MLPQPTTQTPLSLHPIPWTAAEIVAATGGDLLCGDLQQVFTGISIDSRSIVPGSLFVAIRGQVHDGHRFIPDVLAQGICGLVIDRAHTAAMGAADMGPQPPVVVVVRDTTRTIGDLAAYNRERAGISVVAVTGSNGKTSTRELTTAVVSRRYRTLSTSGNLNNEIGLPMTLLKLNRQHRWAVVELGMNHPGEIRRLAEICRPDLGIITNIASAHLEGLGSIEGVMRAKGELLEKMKPGGTAILNADDPKVSELAVSTDLNVVLFGLGADAAVRAGSIESAAGRIAFRLMLPQEACDITLAASGRFMVSNALAAAAVGFCLGFSAAEIKAGLESFSGVNGRMRIIATRKKIQVIDDTYNANPASMMAAIAALAEFKRAGRGILVAGDMLELGEQADALHRQVGAFAARSHIDRIYLTGDHVDAVRAGAEDEGFNPGRIFCGTREEILADLFRQLAPDDWVLVKGSRGMAMEKIVQGLKEWARGAEGSE